MDIYSIYKITNKINNKSYIGFTNNVRKRIQQHKTNKSNSLIHKAICKHGWKSFEWEIIYQSTNKHHCLNEMESHFIKEYDSINNGYNMIDGGCKWNGKMKQSHSEKVSKTYQFLNPNGRLIVCNNLLQFCIDNGLYQPCMYMVAIGKRKSHKKWKGVIH